MITRQDVFDTTLKVIRDNVPDMFGDELTDDTVLNEHGNVDSMGFILVITKLEGEFDSKVPDEEWDQITTLGELVDAIYKYIPEENK